MQTAIDSAYIKNHHFGTAYDLIKEIEYGGYLYQYTHTQRVIHRGHSYEEKYQLVSSALRKENMNSVWSSNVPLPDIFEHEFIEGECNMLFKFFKECDLNGLYIPEIEGIREKIAISKSLNDYIGFLKENKEWIPKSLYELAALAQHYGLSTRLLDWTYDFKVAMYFAVSGLMNDTKLEGYMEFWMLDIDRVQNYLNDCIKIIRPRYVDNVNLNAQRGVFTLWPVQYDESSNTRVVRSPLDKRIVYMAMQRRIPEPAILHRIIVPKKGRDELYEYLQDNRYDASRIFPGYAGIIKAMKETGVFHPMAYYTDMGAKFAIDYQIFR